MQHGSPQRTSRRSRAVTPALLAGAALLLTGCSLFDGPTPNASPRKQTPVVEAQYYPDGTAEENLPYFQKTLEDFAATETPVKGESVQSALESAGFPREHMQVTQDETPNGVEALSMFVSVRIDTECLVGQVVAEDRTVFAQTMEAIGPDGDQCLVVQAAE